MMIKSETANLIAEAVANAKEGDNKCQYCGKGFIKESTLTAHQCEPKRRVQQKTDIGVSLGYQTWIRFYEVSQGTAKLKNYDDFAKSQFYAAFVKFGRYCHNIRAINVSKFIDFVLKNNFKLDHWCRDQIYNKYLLQLLTTEAAEDALTRAIEHMQEWAESTGGNFNDYFKSISSNRLVADIRNGRISAWCLYCCDSGSNALANLNEEQISLIWAYIDADIWQKKLKDYPADAELSRHILKEAGL
jgi:hypothetical protein